MKRLFVLSVSLMLLLSLFSACSSAPAQAIGTPVDVAGIHTMVAGTMLATSNIDVDTGTATATPSPFMMAEVALSQTPEITPPDETTATPSVISLPTMANVPTLAGQNAAGIRVLEQPAAVTRDGITLAVEQVLVFPDQIELVYTVRDIPHAVLFDPFTEDNAFTCSGPASYPNLILPDGTAIYPENYLLDGKAMGTITGPFASSYLIHIYKTALPETIREMKLVLDCLELAHIERAPRNWEVPFRVIPRAEKPS